MTDEEFFRGGQAFIGALKQLPPEALAELSSFFGYCHASEGFEADDYSRFIFQQVGELRQARTRLVAIQGALRTLGIRP